MQTAPERPPLRQDRLEILMSIYRRKAYEVARQAGISPQHLSQVLSGHKRGTPEVLARIERAILGLPEPGGE